MPRYREALIETAVFVNAAQTAYNLRLALEQEGKTDIQVVYGVFDLVTHRVWTAPYYQGMIPAKDLRLAYAPANLDEFEELAIRMALRIARKVSPGVAARSPGA